MAPPRRSLRLARELSLDPFAELEGHHFSPHVLRRLCELADEKLIGGDQDILLVARLCCRIGGQLGTDEARARSFGSLASALRSLGRFEHAERALGVAFAAAPSHRRGDLFRRRAWLRIYQGRLPEALQAAETAIGMTSGSGRARSRGAYGVALYYSENYRAAIDQLERSLEETDPDAEIHYCTVIHNYATALAKGTDEEAAKAIELCRALCKQLKDRHQMQRAKLWWTVGLLHERLGNAREAWWAMNTARRSLIVLQAAPEVASIVADMARVSPRPKAVRHICAEAAELIASHRTLGRPLRSLASAAREMIPEAAAALKQAASVLAPCPAV